MPFIRIPKEQWGKVWHALIAAGPTSRVTADYIYAVSEDQVKMLRRKKLPFEMAEHVNGIGNIAAVIKQARREFAGGQCQQMSASASSARLT